MLSEKSPLVQTPAAAEVEEEHVGGEKDIGGFGGFALLVNNITGPAMVTLPILYQQAGWFTPTALMIVMCLVSSLSSTLLVEAMALVPGNDRFQSRVELTTLAHRVFPGWAYYLTHVLMALSLMSTIISSVIISAQTTDLILIAIFNWTGALEIYPHPGLVDVREASLHASPFGSSLVISLGFVIVLLVAVPFGYWNLDDNIKLQIGAFLFMCIMILEWVVDFAFVGLDFGRVKAFSTNQSQVLGTIVYNYAFVTSVPSWVNEKDKNVSINKSIWWSTILSTLFFFIIGLGGGLAFKFGKNEDILDAINHTAKNEILKVVSRISVYLFPLIVLLSSIPIFSIIIRYNLVDSQLCGKAQANFWGVIFPWILSVIFYSGQGIFDIINWTALLVNGFINFVIPLLLYFFSVRQHRRELAEAQKDIPVEDLVEKDYQKHYFAALPCASIGGRMTRSVAICITVLVTALTLAAIGWNVIAIMTGHDYVD